MIGPGMNFLFQHKGETMASLKIKPQPGILIRRPENGVPIKPEGETVKNNSFWRRRIKTGEVILLSGPDGISNPAPAAEKPKPDSAKPEPEQPDRRGPGKKTSKTK